MSAETLDRTCRVSTVMLCWNSAPHLPVSIPSILGQHRNAGEHDELIVVDNGSTDGSREILRELSREWDGLLTVIELNRNCGTTVSRNLGLRAARGRYIAIIDSDVRAEPTVFDDLITCLRTHSRCGIVAPRLVYPNGRFQLSTDRFPTIQRKLRRALSLRAIETRAAGGAEVPPPSGLVAVDYAISAFWLMNREVVNAVGNFDERIFYSPEDVDYCLRVWKAGYRVLYVPAVVAVHDAQEISRTFVPSRATFHHIAGLAYLFAKHRFGLRAPRRAKLGAPEA